MYEQCNPTWLLLGKIFLMLQLKVWRLHEGPSVSEILTCFDTNVSYYVDFCTIYYTFNGFSSCKSYTILLRVPLPVQNHGAPILRGSVVPRMIPFRLQGRGINSLNIV